MGLFVKTLDKPMNPEPTPEERRAITAIIESIWSDPALNLVKHNPSILIAHRYAQQVSASLLQRAEAAEKEWQKAHCRARMWAFRANGFADDNDNLKVKLAEAEARIKELEADKSRLDWIQTTKHSPCGINTAAGPVWELYSTDGIEWAEHRNKDIRSAIDSAMKSQPTSKPADDGQKCKWVQADDNDCYFPPHSVADYYLKDGQELYPFCQWCGKEIEVQKPQEKGGCEKPPANKGERCSSNTRLCTEVNPCLSQVPYSNLLCTRPGGHDGDHIACTERIHNYKTWPQKEKQ
jgi:hypothetical protein